MSGRPRLATDDPWVARRRAQYRNSIARKRGLALEPVPPVPYRRTLPALLSANVPGLAFARYVDRSAGPEGCWPWMGNRKADGYGRVTAGEGRFQYAHRVALSLALNRPIRDGLCVCHSCDNPPCCNPAHLWEGTNADNQHDKVAKGRNAAKPALTGPQIRLFRDLWPTTPMALLAPVFAPVSRRTLYRVAAGVPPYQSPEAA